MVCDFASVHIDSEELSIVTDYYKSNRLSCRDRRISHGDFNCFAFAFTNVINDITHYYSYIFRDSIVFDTGLVLIFAPPLCDAYLTDFLSCRRNNNASG